MGLAQILHLPWAHTAQKVDVGRSVGSVTHKISAADDAGPIAGDDPRKFFSTVRLLDEHVQTAPSLAAAEDLARKGAISLNGQSHAIEPARDGAFAVQPAFEASNTIALRPLKIDPVRFEDPDYGSFLHTVSVDLDKAAGVRELVGTKTVVPLQ